MKNLQRVEPYTPAERDVLVDYTRPLPNILLSRNVNPFNGKITDGESFPPQPERGTVLISPSVRPFTREMSVAEACANLRRSHGDTLADLWMLAHCAHLLSRDGQKIYAFARGVEVGGIMQYPYIGITGTQRYISLVRESFSVESGCGALTCQQVLVR